MSKRTIRLIAAACVVAGVVAGVAGAQVIQNLQRQYLNTGLFSVGIDENRTFPRLARRCAERPCRTSDPSADR